LAGGVWQELFGWNLTFFWYSVMSSRNIRDKVGSSLVKVV
jgi:hypothetical protein